MGVSSWRTRGGSPEREPRVRRRLLLAFLLVTFPPLLFLSLAATRLLESRLDEGAWTQLDVGLRLLRARIDEERERAAAGVDAVVREDLRGPATPDPFPSDAAAARAGLDTLELLDREGRVLASHHWPAGFGLRDRDRVFGESAFRMETVADGYGAARKLTVVAERKGRGRSGEVTVRGGRFLDPAFFSDLQHLLSLEIGLRDEAGREWLAATRGLSSWTSPALDAERGRRPPGEPLARWVAVASRPRSRPRRRRARERARRGPGGDPPAHAVDRGRGFRPRPARRDRVLAAARPPAPGPPRRGPPRRRGRSRG